MRLVNDARVGEWITAGTDTSSRTVRGLVPGGFEDYGVIFHPAFREISDGEQPTLFAPWNIGEDRVPVYHRAVRWGDVAQANGRTAHPTMEWAAITGRWEYRYDDTQPGIWDIKPQWGSLPQTAVIDLCRQLSRHTSTPADCFFGASAIYGDLPDYVMTAGAELWDMRLLTGPLLALPSNPFASQPEIWGYRSANMWWPTDHAWCVHSDYDLQESYIGGSHQCIADLAADPSLEVMRIDRDQLLVDDLNPEPEGHYNG
jgi:hypothetical protein